MDEIEDFLTSHELAEMLRLREQTVRAWRVKGRGPAFLKLRTGTVLYRRSDVLAWLALAGRRTD